MTIQATRGPASLIKSIQAFSISIDVGTTSSADATISSVNTAKARVVFGGFYYQNTAAFGTGSFTPSTMFANVRLLNATTVRAEVAPTRGGTPEGPVLVRGTVVEYH